MVNVVVDSDPAQAVSDDQELNGVTAVNGTGSKTANHANGTETAPKASETNGTSDTTTDTTTSESESAKNKVEVEVEAGSRVEYKRVDEVWDSDASEWVLRDSGPVRPKSKEDKYREFSFTIVRSLHPTTLAVNSTVYVDSQVMVL